jgi:hypothetical protein
MYEIVCQTGTDQILIQQLSIQLQKLKISTHHSSTCSGHLKVASISSKTIFNSFIEQFKKGGVEAL